MHVCFLQAKALGDVLVVGLIPDSEILRCKGPPVLNERERYLLVDAVKWVDEVLQGEGCHAADHCHSCPMSSRVQQRWQLPVTVAFEVFMFMHLRLPSAASGCPLDMFDGSDHRRWLVSATGWVLCLGTHSAHRFASSASALS
jgi:hypothetical protein